MVRTTIAPSNSQWFEAIFGWITFHKLGRQGECKHCGTSLCNWHHAPFSWMGKKLCPFQNSNCAFRECERKFCSFQNSAVFVDGKEIVSLPEQQVRFLWLRTKFWDVTNLWPATCQTMHGWRCEGLVHISCHDSSGPVNSNTLNNKNETIYVQTLDKTCMLRIALKFSTNENNRET